MVEPRLNKGVSIVTRSSSRQVLAPTAPSLLAGAMESTMAGKFGVTHPPAPTPPLGTVAEVHDITGGLPSQ